MAVEGKQPALVAGHKIVGVTRFVKSQQKIVAGIGRAIHGGERTRFLGEPFDLVEQAAGLVGFDEFGDVRLFERGEQLVEMRRAGQEREFSLYPGVINRGGLAGRGDQGGDEDVGIEHHAHQALPSLGRDVRRGPHPRPRRRCAGSRPGRHRRCAP